MRLMAILVTVLAVSACGGKSSSPTAPTPAASSPTRIIAIEGSLAFGDVVVGQSKDMTLTIRNTGNSTLTLNDATGPASLASLLVISTSTKAVPVGGTSSMTFRLTPTSPGALSGTITITGDQTSGTNTVPLTATAVAAATPPVTVVGVVTDANTRAPVGGVTVSAVKNDATVQPYARTTTDGNGFYSIVVPSATSISLSFLKDGYNFQSSGVTFTGDSRRDIALAPFWSLSGVGNTVFDMPRNVTRVRVTGRYTSNSSNFIIRVAGRLLVNELLGTGWQSTTYEGTHLTSGGVVEIVSSSGVSWTFTQVQ